MEQYMMSWVVALLFGGAAIVVVLLPWGKGRGQVEGLEGEDKAPSPDKKVDEIVTLKEGDHLEVEPTPSPPVVVEEIKAADPPQREVEAHDQPKGSRKRRRNRETDRV